MRQFPRIIMLVAVFALLAGAACSSGLGRWSPPDRCTPNCVGRSCGSDGCDGTCGTCEDGLDCEPISGRCVGDGEYDVTGALDIEYMYGNVSNGEVFIAGPEEMPARDLLLTVIDADGNVLGANSIDGDNGEFSIPVSREPVGTERLVISAMWAVDGEVLMAVLDPATADNDTGKGTFDAYTWYVNIPAGGNIGRITIHTEDWSGALFIFMMNKMSMENIVQPMVDKNYGGAIVPLAIFYGAWNEFFVPCTCYNGETDTYIGNSDGPHLLTKLSIVDSIGESSAWGWSVLFHEFGHYILGAYSKDNSPGGPHYIGVPVNAPMAFSEGWATFMSLVTATKWFDDLWPVYWDIQGGSWFYVDFEEMQYRSKSFGNGTFVEPSLAKSISQQLDENWVARLLYMIWDETGTGGAGETMTLDQMTDVVSSQLFLRGLDWARDADLYNFLDTALCLYPELDPDLQKRVRGFKYPYSGNPDCGKAAAAAAIPIVAAVPMWPGDPTGPAVPMATTRTMPPITRGPRAVTPDNHPAATTRFLPPARRDPIPPFKLFGATIKSAVRVETRNK